MFELLKDLQNTSQATEPGVGGATVEQLIACQPRSRALPTSEEVLVEEAGWDEFIEV